MKKKTKPRTYYNEPLVAPKGDSIPKLKRIDTKKLGALVNTRIELESSLRVCGLDKTKSNTKTTSAYRKVLTSMLAERDSPMSASLRCRVADIAVGLKLKEATATLRRIALDDHDDISTRIGAVRSYIGLNGKAASRDLPELLRSKSWQIKSTVYIEAMKSSDENLRSIAQTRFTRERNSRIRHIVGRQIFAVKSVDSTQSDD